ncbi:MAG: S8 family serine peptidase [Planctomycetota bacterium]|nr:S8 family serine peptidase [Planctomycetota bacterium]
MRNCVLIALFALSAAVTGAFGADANPPVAAGRSVSFRQDRILVKPKANADLSQLHLSLSCTPVWQSPAMQNLQVVKLPPGANVPDTIVKYMSSGLAEYAEPDYEAHLTADPNDPQYASGTQWSLHNTGDGGGVAGADIHAREAWDIQRSAAGIVVATVDTGIRFTHEDLAANVWVNPGEIAGNGTDDDGDGIIDDVHGVNTLDDSGDVRDDNGHGTHVSGIIGAVGNNGKGVAGIAWRVQLMTCKAFDSNGAGSISTIVKAIDYARAHGAHIINNSYGVNVPLEAPLLALKDAIAATRSAGIIFVVAAGNEAIDNDQLQNAPSFPASFDADNIVSVTSTNRADALSFFSNYGLASVDLGAPGEDIVATWYSSDTSYSSVSGTSESAPMVSGAFALMMARFTGESYLQLLNRVFASTDPLPGLQGRCRTGGRLNLYKALASTSSRPANDDFAAAIAVGSTPFQVSGINAGASKEGGEPNHAGDAGGASVWWSWTAPSSGRVLVSTAGSTFSTVLGVYTGPAVTQLTAAASSNQGAVVFDAVVGTTYYLAVDGVGGATGSIALSLKYPPSNDDFVNAAIITSEGVQEGSNVNATKEAGEPLHASNFGGTSVWWQWTPASSTRVVVSTQDSTFDTVLAVYTGATLAGLAEVAGNNDEDSLYGIITSRVEFDAVAGTTYWIAVDGFDGASGHIRLHLRPIKTTVRIFATVPWASEAGPKPGQFTVTRTGSTDTDLVVSYRLLTAADAVFTSNGLAVNGTDFQRLSGTVTIPPQASSATITVTPIENSLYDETLDVTLLLLSSPDYEIGSHSSDTVHIQDNETFGVLSALTATPNPAYARSPVTFSFAANSNSVTYSWDFGDGTTDTSGAAQVEHAFAAAGTYTVTVTAVFESSGFVFVTQAPTLTETIAVQVNPPQPLSVSSLVLKMDLAAGATLAISGRDRCAIKGDLALPKDFIAAGTIVQVDIGGLPAPPDNGFFGAGDQTADTTDTTDDDAVSATFALNRAGSATGESGAFRLSHVDKSGSARFGLMLSRISLADALDDEGLTNESVQGKRVVIPVTIVLGQTSYYLEVPASYSAKAGKKGIAKGPVR